MGWEGCVWEYGMSVCEHMYRSILGNYTPLFGNTRDGGTRCFKLVKRALAANKNSLLQGKDYSVVLTWSVLGWISGHWRLFWAEKMLFQHILSYQALLPTFLCWFFTLPSFIWAPFHLSLGFLALGQKTEKCFINYEIMY